MSDDTLPITPRQDQLPPQEFYRVLLIDDNESDRDFVKDVFDIHYHDRIEMIVCEDLGSGLHLLKSQPKRRIDVVLLDLGLGETKGLETYKCLRQHAPHIPVIAFTGDDDPMLCFELKDAGCSDVLYKERWTSTVIYQAICSAAVSGRYSSTVGRVEVIKLPETMLREARELQDRLHERVSDRPKNAAAAADNLRDEAHMKTLEFGAGAQVQLGTLIVEVQALRKDVELLDQGHRVTQSSVHEIQVHQAKNTEETKRETIRQVGHFASVGLKYLFVVVMTLIGSLEIATRAIAAFGP